MIMLQSLRMISIKYHYEELDFFLHILQVKQNNLSSFENNLQYFASHFNFCIPSVFFELS